MKQVITVHQDGSLSGLERKAGQGVDLKQFGPADVQRVSHILWHEGTQRGWYIEFLLGPRAGKLLTKREYLKEDNDELVLFDNYDDAVKVEIEILDKDRLNGNFPK